MVPQRHVKFQHSFSFFLFSFFSIFFYSFRPLRAMASLAFLQSSLFLAANLQSKDRTIVPKHAASTNKRKDIYNRICRRIKYMVENRVKKNQIYAQLILSTCVFRQPLHVSGISRPIIRRYNRMYTTIGTYYSF